MIDVTTKDAPPTAEEVKQYEAEVQSLRAEVARLKHALSSYSSCPTLLVLPPEIQNQVRVDTLTAWGPIDSDKLEKYMRPPEPTANVIGLEYDQRAQHFKTFLKVNSITI
jgi:hypothetical protein